MAGIYVHIPFCRRACHYCDFHFTTNFRDMERLVRSIMTEIEIQKEYLNGESISTIYFGGGTPSLLPSSELERIIRQIHRNHSVESNLELTLEANPEDLSLDKLTELRSLGINRLSLGTQSFIDHELKWMNRMHTADQAKESITNAQKVGFANISIDLIFGLPQQTDADWAFNLGTALDLNIQHISSYGLTIEKKTVLSNRIKKGLESVPDDEASMRYFQMNMDVLPANGFEHYEISNFARNGFISRHNSSYWKGVTYLGIGPSAHSFNGISRQWNVRSNARYMAALENGEPFSEKEILTIADRLNEQVMIGLRTKWGVQKDAMENILVGSWNRLMHASQKLEPENFEMDDETMRLTPRGKLMADGLSAELFFDLDD